MELKKLKIWETKLVPNLPDVVPNLPDCLKMEFDLDDFTFYVLKIFKTKSRKRLIVLELKLANT